MLAIGFLPLVLVKILTLNLLFSEDTETKLYFFDFMVQYDVFFGAIAIAPCVFSFVFSVFSVRSDFFLRIIFL